MERSGELGNELLGQRSRELVLRWTTVFECQWEDLAE